jgi:hypothetical protein
VLTSAENTPFTASGQVHPGRLEAADARKVTVPHIVLASNGEPENVVKEYYDILVGEGKLNGKLREEGGGFWGVMGADGV